MKLNKMKVLSEAEIENIALASSRILEDTGLKIDSLSALKKLKSAGGIVDFDSRTVKFPKKLQEDCLKTVPENIRVVNRSGHEAFVIGDNTPHFASGHNAVNYYDYATGEQNFFSLKNVEDFVSVSHHLDDIEMIGLPASPGDVNPATSLLYSLKAAFTKSDKPVYFSTDSALINHYAIELTRAASPDSISSGCYMISQLSPTSPLYWENGAVKGVIECAERGFPVAILPEPITGLTAPYSLAGLITIHNIEALSGVFITQLIKPGTPVIWASSWTTFDMKKSCALVGSMETTLCRIGGAQIAKHYGIPLHTTAPNSDNHALDEQNSWEKQQSLIAAAAAGNDLIVNCGMYACGMTISLEQLVMDAEMVGQVKRLIQGIDASKQMIAEDLIREVKYRGSYITEDHTINLLHSPEHREPLVAERRNFDIWEKKGRKNSTAEAHDIVKSLLNQKTADLPDTVVDDLNKIIGQCESEIRNIDL